MNINITQRTVKHLEALPLPSKANLKRIVKRALQAFFAASIWLFESSIIYRDAQVLWTQSGFLPVEPVTTNLQKAENLWKTIHNLGFKIPDI